MSNFYQLVQQRVESRSANNQSKTKKSKNKKRSKFKKRMSQIIDASFVVGNVNSAVSSEFAA